MILFDYAPIILNATWITFQIAISSLLIGLILSLIFTGLEFSSYKIIKWPTFLFVTMIRGLPEMLIILFIFFGLTELIYLLTGVYIELSPFWSGTIALSLIFASYASQSIRGALKAVSIGQKNAALSLGFKKTSIFFYFILPQAIRHAIPGLTNQWLVLLKDTALVSLIGVTELLKQSQLIATATQQSFNWYAIVAVIYLFISFISKCLINKIEKKYSLQGS